MGVLYFGTTIRIILWNIFLECFGHFWTYFGHIFWTFFFTFFAYKWQTPRKNVHEVGQPIGMRTTVELSNGPEDFFGHILGEIFGHFLKKNLKNF